MSIAGGGEVLHLVDGRERHETGQSLLQHEMKLIRGAAAALRAGGSSGALARRAEHQAEHPRASLAPDREGLRAIAQCQVGAAGATAFAERFIARSPRSPLAPRLKSACKLAD